MADLSSCEPADLAEAAKCYKCIPEGMQPEVIICLLNEILGTGLTPQQLMERAACFKCIPSGMQNEVQSYLLCQISDSNQSEL
jgi:hypothetical protein